MQRDRMKKKNGRQPQNNMLLFPFLLISHNKNEYISRIPTLIFEYIRSALVVVPFYPDDEQNRSEGTDIAQELRII